MKKMIIALLFIGMTQLAGAQFTFFSSSNDLVKKGSTKSEEHEEKLQIYNISFKDMILVHNVYDSLGLDIADSQIYQIIEVKESSSDHADFVVKSGVTGKSYEYRLTIIEGLPASLLLIFSDSEYDLRYNGSVSALKTIKQE